MGVIEQLIKMQYTRDATNTNIVWQKSTGIVYWCMQYYNLVLANTVFPINLHKLAS